MVRSAAGRITPHKSPWQETVIVRRRGARDVALLPATENSPVSSKLRTSYGRRATHGVSNRHCDGRREGGPSLELPRDCVERCWVKRDPERVAVFQPEFREDLRFWVKTEHSTAIRVLDLVEAVMRDPSQGLRKPEPLRYVLAGCWSRRISQEHRLVYRVTDEAIDFLQARYHY
jgi:toxin YoeB